jgi:hypothetical protein
LLFGGLAEDMVWLRFAQQTKAWWGSIRADLTAWHSTRTSPVPRLSILIPCLGGAAEFDGTLVATLQHRPAGAEIVVVHRLAYDDPYALSGEVEFVQSAAPSLCGLLNAGLAASSGEIIHVLACGLTPCEGWAEPALAQFRDEEVAVVAPAVMHHDTTRLAAAGVRFTPGGRRHLLADQRLLLPGSGHLRAAIGGPTLAAGFYRRELLAAIGGFDAAATDWLADVSLALDLVALELRCEFEPAARIVQTSDPWASVPHQAVARGRAAERLFWRQASQVGLPVALAAHPMAVAIDQILELPQVGGLVGRAAALGEVGSVRRNQARLADAAAQLRQQADARAKLLAIRNSAASQTSGIVRRKAA